MTVQCFRRRLTGVVSLPALLMLSEIEGGASNRIPRKRPRMADLGYIRVSTTGQTLDQQRDALIEAGVDPARIYDDTVSGTKSKRPGLDALLTYARPGDRVTVVRLDRLGRNLSHTLATIELLHGSGIALHSLRQQIDFTSPAGRFQAAVFMAMAEYEREMQRERIAEARAAVESRGGKWGRKAKLTPAQVQIAKAARAAGQSPTEIARELGCSRATLYRVTGAV